IGCFDHATGKRLGSESFVPGYTQIYSFEDRRPNTNPTIQGFAFAGVSVAPDERPQAAVCPLTDDQRKQQGCSRQEPTSICTTYDLKVLVPSDVGETDPDATGPEGQPLTE